MPTRLLLVDDDPVGLQALYEALLQRLPESVIDIADSSAAALLLLRDFEYHAVVSDIRMAGLDGMALLNQVRERWPETPVVLVTAMGPSREPEALTNGAFAFIEKPVDVERLAPLLQVAMEKVLFRQRVQAENRRSLSNLDDIEKARLGLTLNPKPRRGDEQ